MCGLFALFNRSALDDASIARARAALGALRHRGPDHRGEWLDREHGVFIGHARLSIIDLNAASNQPLHDGDLTIAYNGEIYNFREIQAALRARGIVLTTNGDTEVFVKAWREWGWPALDRLDGMFAAVIWNGQCAQVLSDPFGEKPLYYAETATGVAVSSELRPLADFLGLQPELSGARLAGYLALGFVPPPDTGFPGIRRLAPASGFEVRHGRVAGMRQYWSPPLAECGYPRPQPLTESELDVIGEALVTSVRRRLEADVPLCLFLSSGIDSALVAALAVREVGADPEAVTVSFSSTPDADEAEGAAAIARHLNLRHRLISGEQADIDEVALVLDLFGQPCDGLSIMSIYQMSRLINDRYKVALTGMGGDEVFFGYQKHAFFYRFRRVYALPAGLRNGVLAAARRLLPRSDRLGKLSALFGYMAGEAYLASKNYPAIEALRGVPAYRDWRDAYYADADTCLELYVPYHELTRVMPNVQLPSMDLGSMRASVELRTPFLSRAVVDAVSRFHPSQYLAYGQKSVLRRLLKRYLPAALVDRPKRGFVYPESDFIRRNLREGMSLPGIPAAQLRDWQSRLPAGGGWQRLLVRAILADRFLGNAAPNAEPAFQST